jgi:UDP-glucose 4-epimerase
LLLAFEEVNNIKIPYEIVDRRPGDLASVFADVGRAEKELGWKAGLSIQEACKSAWKFEKGEAL